MTKDPRQQGPSDATTDAERQGLAPAAQRALDEAAARRAATEDKSRPKEMHGRGGAEPVRYGDWEVKGIATDF